jgi:hypothetical protein
MAKDLKGGSSCRIGGIGVKLKRLAAALVRLMASWLGRHPTETWILFVMIRMRKTTPASPDRPAPEQNPRFFNRPSATV